MWKLFRKRKGVFKHSTARQNARGPKTAKIVILTIVGFLCASIWLASTTTVPEVTRASGELMPMGGYRQVQSAEGGVVFQVFVAEGEQVTANQTLAVLRSSALADAQRDTDEEIRSVQNEMTNLNAILTVLDAADIPLHDAIQNLRSDGLVYAASRLSVLIAQQSIQAKTVEQLERTLAVQKEASILTAKRVEARKTRLARVETLQEKRLITQRELDEQRDGLDQLRATQVDVDVRLSQTKKDLNEAQALMDQSRLDLRATLIADIFRLEQKLDAADVRLTALNERIDGLEIRAPEAGIIQAVAFPNFGELIAPGETIFELLPTASRLVAEIEFDPVDIGHLAKGDIVTLKLDTYDARRYGYIFGEITSISPSLVFDPESSREFFRATVLLEQETIGVGLWKRKLRAGMIATAEVVTAERTAIAYLIKPVSRSLENAFGER